MAEEDDFSVWGSSSVTISFFNWSVLKRLHAYFSTRVTETMSSAVYSHAHQCK